MALRTPLGRSGRAGGDDARRARERAKREHREAYDREAAPVLEALRADGLAEKRRRSKATLLRGALGNAIGFTAGPEHFDTIVALVRDPATGAARSEIESFLDHDQQWVRQEARRALAKLP